MTEEELVLGVVICGASILARTTDHLRGTKAPQYGILLRLLIVGCFIAPLTVGSWQSALIMIAVWLVFLRPLAGVLGTRLAVKIYRIGSQGPFEKWVGRPPSVLRKLYRAIDGLQPATNGDVIGAIRISDQRNQLQDTVLDISFAQPDIQSVLRQYNIERPAVVQLFQELTMERIGGMTMGHYLPQAIAYYPRPLSFLLAWNADRAALSAGDVAVYLMDYFEHGKALPTLTR